LNSFKKQFIFLAATAAVVFGKAFFHLLFLGEGKTLEKIGQSCSAFCLTSQLAFCFDVNEKQANLLFHYFLPIHLYSASCGHKKL